jgi:hypothetical protein
LENIVENFIVIVYIMRLISFIYKFGDS